MVLIKAYSDNCHGELLSIAAYEELSLGMSTGDNAMHTIEAYVCPSPDAPKHIVGFTDDGEPIYTDADSEHWNPAVIGGK